MEKLGAYELVRKSPPHSRPAASPSTWPQLGNSVLNTAVLAPRQEDKAGSPACPFPAPLPGCGEKGGPTLPAGTLLLKARFPLLRICSALVLRKLLRPAVSSPWEGYLAGGQARPLQPCHLCCWSSCKNVFLPHPCCGGTPRPEGARGPCPHLALLQVTGRRLWKNVYDELGGSPGSTSAATCTRRHYERYGWAPRLWDLGLSLPGLGQWDPGWGEKGSRPPGQDEGGRGPHGCRWCALLGRGVHGGGGEEARWAWSGAGCGTPRQPWPPGGRAWLLLRLVLPYVRHLKGEDDKPLPPSKPRKQYKMAKEAQGDDGATERQKKAKEEKQVDQVSSEPGWGPWPYRVFPCPAAHGTQTCPEASPQGAAGPCGGCVCCLLLEGPQVHVGSELGSAPHSAVPVS